MNAWGRPCPPGCGCEECEDEKQAQNQSAQKVVADQEAHVQKIPDEYRLQVHQLGAMKIGGTIAIY